MTSYGQNTVKKLITNKIIITTKSLYKSFQILIIILKKQLIKVITCEFDNLIDNFVKIRPKLTIVILAFHFDKGLKI